MKRLLFILILLFTTNAYAADTKTTDLTELTNVNDADVMYIVDDVSGTPTSKKITVVNVFDTIDTSSKLSTILTDETGSGLAVFGTSPSLTTPTLGVATATTLDTGQGANELYDMDQNVQTTDTVTFDSMTLTTTSLTVSNGGTGASSLTDGGLLLGSGTGAITALGVAANGQIPIGDGSTDPQLATITAVATETDVTNGAGSITIGIVTSPTLDGSNFTGVPLSTGVDQFTSQELFDNLSDKTGTAVAVFNTNATMTGLTVDLLTATGILATVDVQTPYLWTSTGTALDVGNALTSTSAVTGTGIVATSAMQLPYSDTLPSCNEGEIFYDSNATSGQRLFVCEGGTYTLQGDGNSGGGGTPGGDTGDIQYNLDGASFHGFGDYNNTSSLTTLPGNLTVTTGVSATTGTFTGAIAANGDSITSDGVLVINATSATSFNEENITNVGQIDVDTVDADGANLALGTGSNQTVNIDSSDWTISATGVQTNMGNITSDGAVTGTGIVATSVLQLPYSDTPPVCNEGEIYYDSNATTQQRLFACEGGTFLVQGDGGSGSASGADTQIQFNDGGSFGGDSDFTWDSTNNKMTMAGASAQILIGGASPGILKITGTGGSNDENLTIDLETTANSADISSTSSVVQVDFGTLNILSGDITSDGQITSTGVIASAMMRASALTDCDTIDTDGQGNFSCGNDASGSGSPGGASGDIQFNLDGTLFDGFGDYNNTSSLTTLPGNLTVTTGVSATTGTFTGAIAANGDSITSDGILVINATSATSFNDENITNVGQIDVDTVDADGATLSLGTGSDQTVTIDSSDWTISATGVQTNMGNITSDAQITSTGVIATAMMRASALTDCDTIDTDGQGNFSCGSDATGGGGSPGGASGDIQFNNGGTIFDGFGDYNNTSSLTTLPGNLTVTTGVTSTTIDTGQGAFEIQDAAADGATKGVASFQADNFNDDGSGDISIDTTNFTCSDLTTTDCGALTSSGQITSTGVIATAMMRTSSLTDCDTIDTDGQGNFSCGSDASGSGSPGGVNGDIQFNNSSAFDGFGDYNSTTSLTTLPGNLTVTTGMSATTGTFTGAIAANGDSITSDGILVINATSSTSFNEENITNVGQIDVDTVDADGASLALGTGSDQTVVVDSSDWTISATGVQANMGNITSDGAVTGTGIVATTTMQALASADPTVEAPGQFGVDETDDQWKYAGAGGTVRVSTYKKMKSLFVEDPVAGDHFTLFKTLDGITLLNIDCIVDPSGSGDSVDIEILECNSTADSCVPSNAVLTCDNDGAADASPSDPTIDANDWVAMNALTNAGSTTQLTVSVVYTIIAE